MKFQNSSIHGFKVMLCIKKRDERTDGRTNNPEAICPSNFFEVGGIMSEFFYVPLTARSYGSVDLGLTPKVGSIVKKYGRQEGQLSVSFC